MTVPCGAPTLALAPGLTAAGGGGPGMWHLRDVEEQPRAGDVALRGTLTLLPVFSTCRHRSHPVAVLWVLCALARSLLQ